MAELSKAGALLVMGGIVTGALWPLIDRHADHHTYKAASHIAATEVLTSSSDSFGTTVMSVHIATTTPTF